MDKLNMWICITKLHKHSGEAGGKESQSYAYMTSKCVWKVIKIFEKILKMSLKYDYFKQILAIQLKRDK